MKCRRRVRKITRASIVGSLCGTSVLPIRVPEGESALLPQYRAQSQLASSPAGSALPLLLPYFLSTIMAPLCWTSHPPIRTVERCGTSSLLALRRRPFIVGRAFALMQDDHPADKLE